MSCVLIDSPFKLSFRIMIKTIGCSLFLFLSSESSFIYASELVTDVDNYNGYNALHLYEIGLTHNVYDLAIKGFRKLEAEGKIQNQNVMTIVDYSQSSNQKRLYVIDLKNKKLLFNTYVAHGRKTGEEFAKTFSNCNGSYQSSLGFYITQQTVISPHTGFALTLDGVEKGFNDNACKRAIIMHGADYVSESFIKKNGRLGRSLGCPALPPELNKPIIETIKGGTCLFVYNPDPVYLCRSTLLN
jgi:hypothetical protein